MIEVRWTGTKRSFTLCPRLVSNVKNFHNRKRDTISFLPLLFLICDRFLYILSSPATHAAKKTLSSGGIILDYYTPS
jgi:hypothetical protein